MKIYKMIFSLIICILCTLMLQSAVFAQDLSYTNQYDSLLHSSGADKLFDIAPDDAKQILQDNKLDDISSTSMINMSFFDFIASIFNEAKEAITKPFTMFFSCIGIILLCALLNSMKSSFNNSSYEQVFSAVSVICIASIIIIPIANLIIKAAQIIKQSSDFLLSFIPVYVGIITASGKPISAMAYQSALIVMVQIISRVSANVLVPMLSIYMAFCLIGCISREINVESIARAVKNVVIISLSFLMTIFVGLLAVQGGVASSADTVTIKAAKFAIAAFLPVVGGAISEALNSVQGCIGVIKSTVGGFGIATVVATFLPGIIYILIMQFALCIASGISDALSTDKITTLLRCSVSVISLILGIVLVFGTMLIISLGIMMSIAN